MACVLSLWGFQNLVSNGLIAVRDIFRNTNIGNWCKACKEKARPIITSNNCEFKQPSSTKGKKNNSLALSLLGQLSFKLFDRKV